MPKPFLEKWLTFLFKPGDTVRLDAFRVCLGATMALYMRERWLYADEWLTHEGFHVSQPNLSFHPLGMPLLSPELLPWFGALLFGSIFAVIIGWQLRWTAWAAFLCVCYVTFADQYSAFTVNKLFIVSLMVFGLAPKGSPKSIWPIRLFQMSFIIHYFSAGWQKAIFGDWLSNPFALYTQLQGVYRTDFAAWLFQIGSPNMWVLMQYSGLAFELLVPLLFTVKATRRVAFIWGLGFQLMLALCMHQLIYFMLVMSCFYVLFINDSTLHKWLFWRRTS